ncbi:hypothetical protein BH09MYX1_BH09MYX1_14850 [soil metagenome]
MRELHLGDCLEVLPRLPAAFARLVYIDPPFNTGAIQKRNRMRVTRAATDVTASEAGPTTHRSARDAKAPPSRLGFLGERYETTNVESDSYADHFDDYVGFLIPRIQASLRCMTADASIFVHLDAHEVHYVKVALDGLLGRASFMNEIVWAYDYGGRSRDRWPAKHDTILWYARDPKSYVFEYDAIDRIPYMAPRLVTKEKAERGKTPTDVWWNTIVPTTSKDKTGYPTQKPLAIVERIVKVHSRPGDVVLDYFAGSGTTGEAAAKHGRDWVLCDESEAALSVTKRRLAKYAE